MWFIKQSLWLDYALLLISPWPFYKKIVFIIKKYYLLIFHIFKKFEIGEDCIELFGDTIYYDSPYGIAGYQSMLTRQQKLIQLLNITNPDVVIDIGANVGFFSKCMRNLFPYAKIYSIEPIPLIYKCLELNFKGDKKTYLFNIGIYNKSGHAKMQFDKNLSSISHLSNHGQIRVSLETLDNFVEKNEIKAIDILKIDVESFENFVLQGGSKALAITKFLLMEITMENNTNYTISSLFRQLCSKNYNFQLVGFRNYADVSLGKIPVMDSLMKNILYKP